MENTVSHDDSVDKALEAVPEKVIEEEVLTAQPEAKKPKLVKKNTVKKDGGSDKKTKAKPRKKQISKQPQQENATGVP